MTKNQPHRWNFSAIPLPDRKVLEMGEARVLLTTWEVTKDKEAVDMMLARTQKTYGKGAEERIRGYMRWIAKHERLA